MNTFLEEGEFPNPFEKKETVVETREPESIKEEVKPVYEQKPVTSTVNPLRTGQPIRSTFTTSKPEEQPKPQGPRRYTY